MGGKSAIELPWWIDKHNPDEVKAFKAGLSAGRAGKPQPESGKFYVIVFTGWVKGKELRQQARRKP
jgi:hypothetical protein